MSTAPKSRGMDKRIVYGAIAVAVVVLLVCGGIFVPFIVKKLDLFGSSGGGGAVNTKRGVAPKTFREDAVLKPVDAAEGFLGAISIQDYGLALKRFSTIGFQGRYGATTLREVVEKNGKGLIGWTERGTLSLVSQTQDSKTYQSEVGGGPHGSARFEIVVSNEGDGWRVSEFVVLKK